MRRVQYRMHTCPFLPAVGPNRSSVFKVVRIEMRIFADIHPARRHHPRNADSVGRTSDSAGVGLLVYMVIQLDYSHSYACIFHRLHPYYSVCMCTFLCCRS